MDGDIDDAELQFEAAGHSADLLRREYCRA
jgi:hypothetical protein